MIANINNKNQMFAQMFIFKKNIIPKMFKCMKILENKKLNFAPKHNRWI